MDSDSPLTAFLARQRDRVEAIRDVAIAVQSDDGSFEHDEAGNIAKLCEKALRDIAASAPALKVESASDFSALLSGYGGLLALPAPGTTIH